MDLLTKLIPLAAIVLHNCQCFNVDTKFPIVFKGAKNSYFGFSVQLHQTDRKAWALIAAPKANSSSSAQHLHQPGVLNKCEISNQVCYEIILDYSYNQRKILGNLSYKEVKSDMMLGISLDVQPEDGSIVTCGHLWKNLEYSPFYSANGVCYVIDKYLNENNDLSNVEKLLPIIAKEKQVLHSPNVNFYAYGLAGFSAMFTENGKDLILGAPGIYEGKGSLIQYAVKNGAKLSPFPIIPDPNNTKERVHNDSYVGYSLTSGRFFNTTEIYIASGAPRAENDYGCVYIFEPINYKNQELVLRKKILGHKLTEYFGAAVLAVNVNNDEYSDLVVGAPFYSTLNGGDEGRVFVYLSDGNDLLQQKEILKGSDKSNSRFGTSIANCGDLNKDGFLDIAIGAPYEDEKGAVYIYFGSANGVKPDFVQRIAAKDFGVELSGFGIAISKGKDIDSNTYPDILIGAYDTANALLLRSHPVISVYARMEFDIQHILINSTATKCKTNQKEVSCFQLKYCLMYEGNHAPELVTMKIELEVDKYKTYVPRAYFMEDKNVQKIESEITLLENTENCKMQMVYLMDDIQDLITPIKFQLTYNLKEPEVPQFCKSCPVIDATATNTITKEVMFWNGCGDDNECLSDLKLSVKYLSKVERFVIGENNILEMEVKAENLGEPAYNSTIFIKLPEDVMMINQAECTSTSEDQNAENYTLLCNVGNPLTSDSPNIFQLKMDTSRLSKPVDKLVFEFWIETASKEINPSDNFYTVTIPVIFAADIQIRGFAENELIFLQEDNKEVIPISHTYFVSKQLRNPIPVVDVTLKIPIKLTVDGPDFLELTSLQIGNDTANNVPSTCDVVTEKLVKPEIILSRLHRDVSSKRYTHQEHADHSNFDTINLDCTTAVCISISCRAGPFVDTKKIAKFQISGYINLTNLQSSIGEKDVTVLISEGKVTIKDANYGKFVREDRATVATSLEKYGLHQQKIPIWIIIVSVVVGLLLLIVLLSLLYKSGFFRRKEQEEMEKLKNEEENEETLALNGNSI